MSLKNQVETKDPYYCEKCKTESVAELRLETPYVVCRVCNKTLCGTAYLPINLRREIQGG